MNWLVHLYYVVTGANNEGGKAYGFWSGFGGSIPDFLILGGVATFWRKHNCHVHKCWRLNWRATNAGDLVCRKHHPEPHLTHADVIARHKGE